MEKAPSNSKRNRVLSVDYRALVSRADLVYLSHPYKAIEGHPIGNGRMGTMVWAAGSLVNLQINRSDVFAINRNHDGFFTGPTDSYAGCAQVTIDVGGAPFGKAEGRFRQQLSLYEAEERIAGKGVTIRCFVSSITDVLVLEIDDRRDKPESVKVTLRMNRAPEVKTGRHTASYKFEKVSSRIVVEQKFTEKDYYCASAVAAEIVGSETAIPVSPYNQKTITAPAKKGRRIILISSAASWSRKTKVAESATKLLDRASGDSYSNLHRQHVRWWAAFWSRTFVHLSSADSLADFAERIRTLHLYYMASTSRGNLPSKWNGLLFITEGDKTKWGSQFVVWTTEMMYFPLFAADAVDLTDPYFTMYLQHLPACRKAAEQRWGSKGAYYPEIVPFDGPVVLPEDAAKEFRDFFTGKNKTILSKRALSLCRFEGHLCVVAFHALKGRYSWASHIASSGSELAVQAWWRYRYTGDTAWLRTHAYPLLRDTVEFYRHLVKKGEDGRYHIHGTNVHEQFWAVTDGIMDLAAIRGTAPLAIKAANILGIDEQLCAKWKDLLDNLAPYPMGNEAESVALTDGVLSGDVWAAGHLGEVAGDKNSADSWLTPVFPFEDWTIETRNPETDAIVRKALDIVPRMSSILKGNGCGTAIRTPIVNSRAGRGEKLPSVLMTYYNAFSPLANGLSQFEALQDPSVEHLACISMTLQDALVQSVSARPGEQEVINILPAWPREWNAAFRLLVRGGFLVTVSFVNGLLEFVEIESRNGEFCRLRNPWKKACILTGTRMSKQELNGEILSWKTEKNGRYLILPRGRNKPVQRRIVPAPVELPFFCSYTLPDGKELRFALGRV